MRPPWSSPGPRRSPSGHGLDEVIQLMAMVTDHIASLSPPPPMSPVEKKLVQFVARTVYKAVSAPKTVESAVFLSQAQELHGCNLVTSGSGLSKH
jgi:hypothetical protein